MEEAVSIFNERFLPLMISLALSAFIIFIAAKNNFFKLDKDLNIEGSQISALYVFQAFALFLVFGIFLVPSLLELYESYFGNLTDINIKNGLLNIFSSSLTLAAFLYLLLTLSNGDRQIVLGVRGNQSSFSSKFKDYLNGAFSWIIIYPFIIFVGQLISLLVAFFYQGPEINQVAVDHVRKILSYEVLFTITAIFIVTIIPFIEELLFRGFLQGWLKAHVGRFYAIIITSLIFALFHFSSSQGVENFELVISLFVLSCFLGFLKEKYQSLFASIGLHSTFNLMSLLMIAL